MAIENEGIRPSGSASGGGAGFHRENVRRRARYTLVFLILAAALIVITILNITIGNVSISGRDILRILFLKAGEQTDVNIIWLIRLPRVAMAFILGGALALSGFLLQTFFENPIAGPFVLGISSGAKMVVAIVMILLLDHFRTVSSWALVLAAFAGSLMITAFILMISRRVHHMASLLVSGIMVGYICSAVSEFVITFAEDADIVNLHGWSQGSFSGMSWGGVGIAAVIVAAALAAAFCMSKPIGAFQMGEKYAQSMGVNIRTFRIALILLSSVLSATVTAFAGPISFVGIAVPVLIKKALNTAKPLVVIPATFLGGAVFCMACDLIARTLFSPTELNISTVTAVFGAPVVIMTMIRRQKERWS